MITIKFPMIKERTGYRRGPRYVIRPDRTGLYGAAFCAASMISKALSHREWAPYVGTRDEPARARIERLNMRRASLWARCFAGQIDTEDPRLDAVQIQLTDAVAAYCARPLRSSPISMETGTATLAA